MIQQFHSLAIFEKKKLTNFENTHYSNIHSSSIYNCQTMEATKVSINRLMNKEDVEGGGDGPKMAEE